MEKHHFSRPVLWACFPVQEPESRPGGGLAGAAGGVRGGDPGRGRRQGTRGLPGPPHRGGHRRDHQH